MSDRPQLRALASRLGIEPRYDRAPTREATRQGTRDSSVVEVSDETLVALVAARGLDASSEAAAGDVLERLERARTARAVEPLRVVEQGAPDAGQLVVRRPPGGSGAPPVRGLLTTESGERFELGIGAARAPDAAAGPGWTLPLPGDLPLGYHRIELEPSAGRAGPGPTQVLVVTPQRAVGPEERLGERRGWGIHANLYAIRGERGLGHGDLGDLHDLVELAARHGASFVGINPIHAGSHARGQGSPYAPLDRAWYDPLYLDLERIPELADCAVARAHLDGPEVASLRSASSLDRARIWRSKRAMLLALFEARRRSQPPEAHAGRNEAPAGRPETPGDDGLRDHATFVAIADWLEERGDPGVDPWDWRTWPPGYRSSSAPDVERFRDDHRGGIDFHVWLQEELVRQLGGVAGEARRAGLALGLCIDLALGSRPGGVETWRAPSLFASGVEAGAPPDAYAPEGQSWGFPPLDPARLVDGQGHLAWLALLRASLVHAGALRLDHVMSLERLYWVPAGAPAREGAYVRYPDRELLGLLALESRRHGAVLIGEDLGTVPPGFSQRMQQRGLLSTRLLYFERDDQGFRPASEYPERALASANTHDLAPLAGWWSGADLSLRSEIGQLAGDAGSEAWAERARDRAALAERLGLDADAGPEAGSADAVTAATVDFLGATPSLLVGVSLDDLAGERLPINLPGVPESVYPSWTRRMDRSLGEIERSPLAARCFAAMRRNGRASGPT